MSTNTRIDFSYTPRDCASDLILFLMGYYLAPSPFDRAQEIEIIKECYGMYHDQEVQNAARGESPSLFVDAPAYYAILARLLGYMPLEPAKDSEGWSSRLTLLAHTTLYQYLETLCDITANKGKDKRGLAVDIAIQEAFDRPQGVDQLWLASIICKDGETVTMRVERRGTSFHVTNIERIQEHVNNN